MGLRSSLFALIVVAPLFVVAQLQLASEQPPVTPTLSDNHSALLRLSPKATGPDVLVLTATAGFEHESIANATKLMQLHAEHRGWNLVVSQDANQHFGTSDSLRQFDVVVFLLTSGSIFSDAHKVAFQGYVQEGGAVVGVHSAIDTNKDWPFFTDMLGVEFVGHPNIQWARINTVAKEHPTAKFLPETWETLDEYYNFATPLQVDDKKILLAVDGTSYEGGLHSDIHPMSWTKRYLSSGARIWVTALGHADEMYSSYERHARLFQEHLALGVEWAANGSATASQG